MGGLCSIHNTHQKCVLHRSERTLKRGYHLEYVGIGGRIVLKWLLGRLGRSGVDFVGLECYSNVGFYESGLFLGYPNRHK